MIGGDKGDILKVSATLEDIEKSYGRLSKLYGTFEGIFEKRLDQNTFG